MKKALCILFEILMSFSIIFGLFGIFGLISETPIDWGAVFVGIVWCFLSLFILLKLRKVRKGIKKPVSVFPHKQGSIEENTVQAQFSTQSIIDQMPIPEIAFKPPEKRKVRPDELNYHDVIQRYLTTDHSKVSAIYDFYSYFRAEFDCMLRGIPRAPIALHNQKVLRKQEILTPFEKSAPITTHTTKAEVANFVVIDTETTGIRTGGNDIIEVSAVKFENFAPVSIFTTLLKPRKPIPEDATRVNGITDEMVQDAPTFAEIKGALEAFIGNCPIVAHNAEFDVKFLHVSGMDFQPATVFYDTLELSRLHIREYDGTKLPNYKLETVCDECCIYFDGAHRSSADALATGLLFIEIVKAIYERENIYDIAFPSTPISSIEELDDWDYYQTKKPVKTFTVTDRSEDAFAGYYSVGDEVEQEYDWEKDKDTLEIGYGTVCNMPRSVQTFFEENGDNFRMFVLDAYEDDNGRVKVKIGIYPNK